MADTEIKKSIFAKLGTLIKSHKLISIIVGVVLAGGIATGVLFATGVLGGSSKITDSTLREMLAAEGTMTIKINNNVKSRGAYEVNGNKTIIGKGKITVAKSCAYVFSVNEDAEFSLDGVEVNVKNTGTNAVIVRAGAKFDMLGGTISYPKQYAIMNYGDTTISGGEINYAGAGWVYVKANTEVNVTGGHFEKSTSAGFEVEKRAVLNISGDTVLDRAGTNTINNLGTVNMTGGTINQCETWTITNHNSLTMDGVTINDCALKGSIYNYEEATKCEISNCTFANCKTYQIYNEGEAYVKNTTLSGSNGSTINNKNIIHLENVKILNSNYHALYNERGTVDITNCEFDGTVYKAVQNKAGYVTIDGLKTDNIGGTALGNVAVVAGGDYGWIKAKNLEISGAQAYSLVSYGGEVEVSDSIFNISVGTNIYIRDGKGTFNNIKVYGSSTEGKAAVCGGSTTWRNSEIIIGGADTYITGGSRGISNYGKLTLNGGTITGNKSSGEQLVGAGVYNVGEFVMNDGIITGNEALSYGGGVRNGTSTDPETGVKHFGVMYMNGGKITGNLSHDNGGGISIGAAQCGLYMTGGEISGNRSMGKGDGVLVAGTFEMSGSAIVDDNDVYIFDQTCKMTVKGSTLAGSSNIVIGSTAWNNAKTNYAVQFDDSSARSALSKRFTCGNDQWSLESSGKYIVATMRNKDISYEEDFDGAETVTVTDFEGFKQAVESTETGKKKIIVIGANFAVTEQVTQPYDTAIKLIDDGTSRTIKRDRSFTGVLIQLSKKSDLVLAGKSGLKISGNSDNVTAKAPLIKTKSYATLVLSKGATLCNAYNGAYATSERAGAVNVYGGQFIVNGGTITGCSGYAAAENGTMTNLAAVYGATSSVISIKSGSLCYNNHGVIRSYGRVYVSGGTFSNNKRVGDGGTCIRACNLIINGGTFRDNMSSNAGCAIYVTKSDAYPKSMLEINGGTFSNNISTRDTDKGAAAGAIYISADTNARINKCTISGNIAGKGDGAEVGDTAGSRHGGMSGAGIYNEGTCYIGAGVKVIDNTAYNSGGGIYSNGSLTINGATITGNKTIGVYAGYGGGGAITLTSKTGLTSSAVITNAVISDNCSGSSGTIYIDSRATVTIKDTEISGNTATGASASGYNSGSAILNKSELTVIGCKINNNTAGSKAALYTDAGSVTVVKDTTFKGNKAAGAAAIANTSADMTLINCSFEANEAQGYSSYSNGGAVMNQRKNAEYKNGQLYMEGCTFTGNIAHKYGNGSGSGGYGGAFYNDYGDVVIKDCSFSGNIAKQCGKDILNSANAGSMVLMGTIDAEENYFNVTKTVVLDESFSAAHGMNLIFNTYTNGAQVFSGAKVAEGGEVFALKTTSDGIVVSKTDYRVDRNGVLYGYAAEVGEEGNETSYWTLNEAIEAAKAAGETVTVLRDNNEDINIPAGESAKLTGEYTLKGKISVAGTLDLEDVTITGSPVVSGTLGLAGASKVTGGTVDIGTTGIINVNDRLSADSVATLDGDLEIGRQVITGTADQATINKFDLAGDGLKQIDTDGKIVIAHDVCKISRTGSIYDTLALAVADAQDGDEIVMLKKVSAAGGITLDKNLTFVSEDAKNVITGKVTVAAGKTLTLASSIRLDTIALGGEGAKVAFSGTLTEKKVAALDTGALGTLGDLYQNGTVLLSGNLINNYDKLTLVGGGDTYMLSTEGKVTGYFEAKIGTNFYKTLEDAYEAAENGDKIELVADAVLSDSLHIDKPVTITTDGVKDRTITSTGRSSNDYIINLRAEGAIICGAGSGSRLIIDNENNAYTKAAVCIQKAGTYKYLTIQNGNSTGSSVGGGLYVNIDGVVMEDCRFLNNCAAHTSGAVYVANESAIVFRSCIFDGNSANAGAATACGGVMAMNAATTATFENCILTNNSALGYGGCFTGTANSSGKFSKLTLTGCSVSGNASGNVGGVAYMAFVNSSSQAGSIVFTGCSFTNNSAKGAGGVLRSNGALAITACSFEGNTSSDKADISIGNDKPFTRTVSTSTFDKHKARAVAGSWTDDETNSFAPEPVALVDGIEYTSLADAVTAAAGTMNVELIADVTGLAAYTFTGDTTVTGTHAIKCPVVISTGVKLTLEDAAVEGNVTVNGTLSLKGASTATKLIVTPASSVMADGVLSTGAIAVSGATKGQQLLSGNTADNYSKFILDEGLMLDITGKVVDATAVARIGTKTYMSFEAAIIAATEGSEIELLANINNAAVTKNVTVTGDFTLAGTTTVAAGKTLTLKGGVLGEKFVLAGTGAKLGFAGTLTRGTVGELDTSALGTLEQLKTAGTAVLAGDTAANYGRLDLKDAAENYSLTSEGKIGAYVEALIGGSTYASLEAAFAEAQSNDVIVLVHDAVIESQMVCTKNLTITTDGCERVISYPSRVGGKYAIYNSSYKLTLKGTGEYGRLVFDGTGINEAQRPLVSFQSTGEMDYVTIQNTTSTNGGYGGGLYINKATVTISNTIIQNNKCYNTATPDSSNNGGGIRIGASGNVKMTNCQLLNNYSSTYGGAITVVGSAGNVELDNCLLEGNSAEKVGGAIYGNQSSGNGSTIITKNGTKFINNTVTEVGATGGAIRSTGNINISDTFFSGNTGDGDISVGDPGSYSFSRSVKSSTFVDKTVITAYSGATATITLGEGGTDNNQYVRTEIAAPALTAASIDFDGEAKTPSDIFTGFDTETMSAAYKLNGTSVSEIRAAGTYTITVTADAAHIFPAAKISQEYSFVINAKTLTITETVSVKNGKSSFEYDGNTYAAADLLDNFNAIKMSATVTKGGTTVTEIKDAGTYTITLTANAGFEFAGGAKTSFTVTITSATKFVAKIGTIGYISFEEAYTAVKAGETITIIDNIELESSIDIAKAITITTDGAKSYTVCAAGRGTDGYMIKISADGVVIKGASGKNLVFDGREKGTTAKTYSNSMFIVANNCTMQYVTLQNSTVDSTVSNVGGAVTISKVANITLSISDSLIQNCSSKTGGAVFVNYIAKTTPITLNASNVTFKNNSAVDGSSIRINGAAAISSCTFTGNVASNDSLSDAKKGGDISVGNNNHARTILNCFFDDTEANAIKGASNSALNQVTKTGNTYNYSGT